METGNTLYKKPFITAAIFLFLGMAAFVSGIALKSKTGDMNYFALVAFGMFFIIISLVVFAVYGAMEKSFKATINNSKILDFSLNDDLFNEIAVKSGEEIKSANKGLLLIMLTFCIVFGLISLLFFEDGLLLFAIFIVLGIFLTIMALIITKYRTSKIKRGSRRVILSKSAAYVAGEFHSWNMPGMALINARYVPHNGNDVRMSYIIIQYGAITIPGPSEYSVIVPIPYEIENKAQDIIAILCTQ